MASTPDPSSLPPLPSSGDHPTHETRETNPQGRSSGGNGSSGAGFDGVNFLIPDPDRPPERVGPYKIVRELGRGGMGMVLLAVREDDKFHKRVAVKLIKRGMDTRSVLRRFELEKQVLGALNHPNIARVFDAGETDDGRPYFVMDYIDGQALDRFCDTHELTVTERLRVFQKICSAVHHAHQNLIVHRDIKPGNILVGTDGEPKLLDFGIAKFLNPSLAQVTMATEWDRGPMTPEYASPEQVQGQPVSTSSDVYALGVLLYELLTGRRPYNLKSRAREAVVKAIIEQEPARPSTAVTQDEVLEWEDGTTHTRTANDLAKPRGLQPAKLRRWLAGDLDNIVLMALRKSPKRRYSSAEEFANDIERHLDGKPVKAAPETWVYVAGKFVRRNRGGVAAAVVVVVAVVGGAAAAVVGMNEARGARRVAESQRDLADRRTAQIREYTGELVRNFTEQIKKQEGSLQAKLVLTRTAVDSLEKLVKDEPGDAYLRRTLGSTYSQLGELLGGAGSNTKGNSDDATQMFRKALAIQRPMLQEQPEDPELKRSIAATLLQLSRVLSRSGATDESGRLIDEAAGIVGEPSMDPVPDELAKVRTAVWLARGERRMAAGELEAAKTDLNAAVQGRRALAAASPQDVDRLRDLTTAMNRMGRLAEARGDTEEAVRIAGEVLAKREEILAKHADGRAKRDVMTALGELARLLLVDDAAAASKAKPHLQRQFDIAAELAQSEGDDRSAEDFARALSDLAETDLHAGLFEKVLPLYERATPIARGVLERDAKNLKKVSLVADIEQRWGVCLIGLERGSEAVPLLNLALGRYKLLRTAQPDEELWPQQVKYTQGLINRIGP